MEAYKNQDLSFEERAVDLVSRMTLEEKIFQTGTYCASLERLGLPAYNYWSEASHGLIGPFRSIEEDVTSFPVCLAMSNTWNKEKLFEVGKSISDEARAYHNINGDPLHFWCPTVNLSRDPRNGRNDEGFGEDPFLAGILCSEYIKGMQGTGSKYCKTIATPKHYALNSSEFNRHDGSSNADEATIREYYARPFSMAIEEGGALSIMTSYNRVNGTPSSVNDFLLNTLLREEWAFKGFVVSDCGAITDVYCNPVFALMGRKPGHYWAKNLMEAAVAAVKAGTDMACGQEYESTLPEAVQNGLLTENIIDNALIRILYTRFKLGLFDDKGKVSYSSLSKDVICNEEHKELALDIARESIVLLKNDNNLLPLDSKSIHSILVIGPNAIYRALGSYGPGETTRLVDTVVNIMPLEGIRKAAEENGISINYTKGWNHQIPKDNLELPPGAEEMISRLRQGPLAAFVPGYFIETMKEKRGERRWKTEDEEAGLTDIMLADKALRLAAESDMVIIIAGTDLATCREDNDRSNTELPYNQNEIIEKIISVNKKTVVCAVTCGPVTGSFIEKVPALLACYYPGQSQGDAIADILFGKYCPNGKISQTWHKTDDDLAPMHEYGLRKEDTSNGKGRTYQYFSGKVLFPFGYGLSYTKFSYSNIKIEKASFDVNETISLSLDVANTGLYDGAEILQLFISKENPPHVYDNKPLKQLKAFQKIFLKRGETMSIVLTVPVKQICFWSYTKKCFVVENGNYFISLAKSSADSDVIHQEKINISGIWKKTIKHIALHAEKRVLHIQDEVTLKAIAIFDDYSRSAGEEIKMTYKSSNEQAAIVTGCGIVKALSQGIASITATVYDNEKIIMDETIALAVIK
jgi:beta-glucosidase